MLVKYIKPVYVQIYVMSVHQAAFGDVGLNCSSKMFFSLLHYKDFITTTSSSAPV